MSDTESTVTIWVDADACQVVVRDILCRAAVKRQVNTVFVANHSLPLPRSPHIRMQQVQSGFDVADHEIAQRCKPGDLVITSNIPLAADIVNGARLA